MADINGNKTGGRVAGTPNKRTQELIELAKQLNADPFTFLVKVMKGDRRELGYEDAVKAMRRQYELKRREFEERMEYEGRKEYPPYPGFIEPSEEEAQSLNLLPIDLRKEAATDLMPFLHAKRKSIEIKEDNSEGNTIKLSYSLRGKSDKA